jgi:hypothetical protein
MGLFYLTQLNEYLSFFLNMDLITQQKSKRNSSAPCFIITEKETQFLNIHSQLNEMITIIQTK